jgi:hypothetical protein
MNLKYNVKTVVAKYLYLNQIKLLPSTNKKRKLSTTITPHLEEGNRQTEQESEKQCQFIYTAELCEEQDFGRSPTISMYYMLLIQLYCHIISMGVNNFVFPNLPIVYDVCTNNISVEGTICCISIF